MTAIVLLNHVKKEMRIVEEFIDETSAHEYCIEFIEQYIRQFQGDKPFDYKSGTCEGFFVNPSKSMLFKWTIVEVTRIPGYLYDTFDHKKHLTISIAIDDRNKQDSAEVEEDHEISLSSLQYYNDIVNVLQKRFSSLHSEESDDDSSDGSSEN